MSDESTVPKDMQNDTSPPAERADLPSPARGLWETICLGALGGVRRNERSVFREAVRRALGRPILPHQALRLRLSSAILTCLAFEVITGIFMVLHYVPTVEGAYASVQSLDQLTFGGWLFRNFHLWNSRILVLLIGLSLLRMIFAADYKDRGRGKWIAAAALFFTVIVFAGTGLMLVGSAQTHAGMVSYTDALADFPVIGAAFHAFYSSADGHLQAPLTRSFVAHVSVLPWIAFFLVFIVHSTRTRIQHLPFSTDTNAARRARPLWPDRMMETAATSIFVLGGVFALAAAFPAELGHAAIPGDTKPGIVDPALRIFSAFATWAPETKYGPLSGAAIAQSILGLLMGLFVLLPFLDRGVDREPKNRPRIIVTALLLCLVFIIAAVFGGKKP